MSQYRITGPDGSTYEVNAPDGASEQDVMSYVQQQSPQSGQPAPVDYASQAATMDPTDVSVARAKDGPFGDFLREQAIKPRQNETPELRDARLYGQSKDSSMKYDRFAREHPYAAAGATLLQGVPFVGEYTDEALGATAGMIGPNDTQTATDAIRGLRSYEDRNNPKTALALRLGGATAATIPALAAAAPSIAASAPASLGMRMLAGAGGGAAVGGSEGAVSGYGSGTDGNSRANNMINRGAVGAVLGGALGAALPAVASAGSAGIRKVKDALTVNRRAAENGLSKPAASLLTRTMEADGTFNGQGASNLSRAGNDAMLADAGPNAQTLLDAAVQRSGKAGATARMAIEARAANANKQLGQSLDNVLGTPQGVTATSTALREGSKVARKTAYDAAYGSPIDYASSQGAAIEQSLTRIPGDIIAKANRMMKIAGDTSKQIMAKVADDGTVTYTVMPDVRQLDYITRALNDAAKAGDGAGALGGQTALGTMYQGLSRTIRGHLKDAVPTYRHALDTAADPITARNALITGQKLLSNGVTRDQASEMLAGMSAAEKTHVMQGVRSQIDDTLANVKSAITDGNMDAREAISALKSLSSRAARDKLGMLVGDNQANSLFKGLDQAATALELRAAVATNSKTFARQSMDGIVKSQTEEGVMNALQSGEPVNAVRRITQSLFNRTPDAKAAIQDKVYSEIVDALVGRRGADAQKTLDVLTNISKKSPENAAVAKAIANRLAVGVGLPVYQTGTQLAAPR